jgi:hypothetical protein
MGPSIPGWCWASAPPRVLPGGTSTLTANLTHNSSGGSGFSVPNGVSVAFAGGSLGTVNPTNTTLTSGTASSTFTAGSSAGNATPTAIVDNARVSATIFILDTVVVNTSPTGLSFSVDGTNYTTAQTFNWMVGSPHSIATSSPQNVSGDRNKYSPVGRMPALSPMQ